MFGLLVVVNGAVFLGYLFGGTDIRAPPRNNLFFINRKSDSYIPLN
jgi:hypothetical protein